MEDYRLKFVAVALSDDCLLCSVQEEMNTWIQRISAATTPGSKRSTPSRSQTMPSSAERGDKKGRFGSMGRKK